MRQPERSGVAFALAEPHACRLVTADAGILELEADIAVPLLV